MQKGQYGDPQQVQSWFREAPADDTIAGTVAGLKRLAVLPTEHRSIFFQKVAEDPGALRILEELKTTV
jgi:hypothetical protein